jgi:hypothetical protein
VEWIQVLFISTNPARFGDIGIGNLAIGITLMKSLAILSSGSNQVMVLST